MFVYLSKKIAVPDNIILKCLSWNKQNGCIACGGEKGFGKVLRFEEQSDRKLQGLAAPSNLVTNQPLSGHEDTINLVTWNEKQARLTSADANGLIIVWMLYKGAWYEEMVNSRAKTTVRGMKWSTDGGKICIVYEDGYIIVGSVTGSRIWVKELPSTKLMSVEWSPDGKLLLFGLANEEVHVYDCLGNFVSKLEIHCNGKSSGSTTLVCISWYNGAYGYVSRNSPCLLICYANGRCQIMRNESDDDPILLDSGIHITSAAWNHNGSVLALAGQQKANTGSAEDKLLNTVHFYSPYGEQLRTLKVPGAQIRACSWELNSLRIALAVDSSIYFANVRPAYKWAYCTDAVIYCYTPSDKSDSCIVFWDLKFNELNIRTLKHDVVFITACDQICCVIAKPQSNSDEHLITLYNTIGTVLSTKIIHMDPVCVCMNKSGMIFVASKNALYAWHYRQASIIASLPMSESSNPDIERLFRSENLGKDLREADIFNDDDTHKSKASSVSAILDFADVKLGGDAGKNPIVCMTVNSTCLVVGLLSGSLLQLALPGLNLMFKYNLEKNRPTKLAINCDSTRLAVIDVNNVLTFIKLNDNAASSEKPTTAGKKGSADTKQTIEDGDVKTFAEHKDVWDMLFAEDDPNLFAMMEKTKLFVFSGFEIEEPVIHSGFLCQFSNLSVKSVLLDEIMRDPQKPTLDMICPVDCQILRSVRELLDTANLAHVSKFIEKNPHPRLWKLLGDTALERQNMEIADQAYVYCKDYYSIQLVKRLANQVQNPDIRRAEIAIYFERYDDAENIYVSIDRYDLAIALRKNLGDWFRVVQLMKSGEGFANDKEMETAYNAIGDHHFDRQNWKEAVKYYKQGRNQERLASCYYLLEEYTTLEKLNESLPENHPLLPELARMFASVGMCAAAQYAYVKCNQMKQAIEICVHLNQWNMAIDLAKKHHVADIDKLLTQYAEKMLANKNVLQAVILYKKAGKFLEAAKLMYQLAMEKSKTSMPPMMIKKMFVMTGLLIQDHHNKGLHDAREKTMVGSKRNVVESSVTLDSLLQEDTSTSLSDTKMIDSAWKGAEAYHYYMLTQRLLYAGKYEDATKAALLLREYENVLNPRDIHTLIALCACNSRAFGTCSNAFIKLETLESSSKIERETYGELAVKIFTRYPPHDSQRNRDNKSGLDSMLNNEGKIPICIISGQPITDYQFWMCPVCRHCAYEELITSKNCNYCPLCHSAT